MRSHALMTEAVHKEGALAGIELWHGGGSVMNRASRIPPHVALRHRLDGDPRRISWATSDRGSWKPQDIRQLLTGRRRPRARRGALASTSSTCMPAWATCRTSFCCRSGIPYRRLRRQSRQSRAHRARTARGDARGGRRASVRSRCASVSRNCARAPSEVAPSEAHEVVGLLAELPDLWDVKLDSSPDRLCAVALHCRGQSRADHRFRQAADHEAGGRRRPLHLSRHDGRRRSGAASSI